MKRVKHYLMYAIYYLDGKYNHTKVVSWKEAKVILEKNDV